jgi:hypothetical protein
MPVWWAASQGAAHRTVTVNCDQQKSGWLPRGLAQPNKPMPFLRAFSMLPSVLVRALVSLPLMLLATGLWAAHHEHPTATDLAIQATLVLFMAALLVNVIISVVAILRERDTSEPPTDHRANRFASELEPARPQRAAPEGATQPATEAATEGVTAKQALSEG